AEINRLRASLPRFRYEGLVLRGLVLLPISAAEVGFRPPVIRVRLERLPKQNDCAIHACRLAGIFEIAARLRVIVVCFGDAGSMKSKLALFVGPQLEAERRGH